MKDSSTNFQLPLHNEAALLKLSKDKEFAYGVVVGTTSFAAATFLIIHALGWLIFGLIYKPLHRIQKLARVQELTEQLLNQFKNENIQVFPLLPVESSNPIDLFIRFPKKTHLFVSIRSKGDAKIIYNETKEILQVRKKDGGGLSTWIPCPLDELADYKRWLDKNRDSFGMSSREAQKTPTTRVLVLWHPTKTANHKEHLYSQFGTMKILSPRKKGTTFITHDDEFVDFVKAWLARY